MIGKCFRHYIKLFNDSFKISVFFKPKSDAFCCESICLLLYLPAINFFLNQILQTYFSFNSVSYIFYLLMAAMGFTAYFTRIGKSQGMILFLTIFIFILTIFSYLIYPEIGSILINNDMNPLTSAMLGLFFYQVPAMIYVSNVFDWKLLFNRCQVYSFITIILGITSFYFFTIKAGSEDIPNYMVYSYNLLTGLGPLVVFSFNNRSVFTLIFVFIGFLCLMIVGARGAQMSFLLIVITCIVCYSKDKLRTLATLGLVSIALFVAYNNLDVISNWMESGLGEYGAHSRTLTKLIDGDFFSQSGRDKLRDIVNQGISSNPLGYGLFGDRYVTATGGWGEPAYCHNIFLELCCDFGVLLGPVIFISLCYSIIKTCRQGVMFNRLNVLLILLPCGFFELFFSNSFLLSIPFFALLGLILNSKKFYSGSLR